MLTEGLKKINDTFSITLGSNDGYLVEISGRTLTDEWRTEKIICPHMGSLLELIQAIDEMEVER